MYVCFVRYKGEEESTLCDCTDVWTEIAVGYTVVCKNCDDLKKGYVTTYPTKIDVADGRGGGKAILEATGAMLPLPQIVRKWGDYDLMYQEEELIAIKFLENKIKELKKKNANFF